MISCISCENVHEFGLAFHSQFRLRYGGFVERQQYDVSVYDGMEFDRYDTPASRYLVYHTDEGRALGVSRLSSRQLRGSGRKQRIRLAPSVTYARHEPGCVALPRPSRTRL